MRILRWGLIIAALLLLLLGGAAGILYATFDPNDHRDNIVRLVEEKTGRTLRLDAPMSLSFFPWLGVELGQVTLENPPGFGEEPFATIEALAVRVKVLPLLDGHLVVDTLAVDGLVLALQRREDGRDNWSDLVEMPSDEGGTEGVSKPDADQGWLKDYAIQGVRLTDGVVSWREEGVHYRVEGLRLATGSIEPGSAVPLEGGLSVQSVAEGVAAELDLAGTLGLSEDLAKVQIPDLRLNLVFRGAGLPPAGLGGELGAGFAFDSVRGALTLDDLVLQGPGGIGLAGRVEGMMNEPLNVEGTFTIEPFSPREALAAMQIDVPVTTDPGVLGSASGNFTLKATAGRLALAPLSIRLDDTRVDGNADVTLGSSSAVGFGLDIDSLDLDRYLPPAEDESTKPAKQGGGQAKSGAGLGGLAGVTAKGTLSIATLKVGGVTMSNTRIGIASGNGAIKLDPMSAALYGGKYRGSLALRAAGSDVNWHATERVEGIRIGPLLRDLVGEERLEGTGEMKADLKGQGLSDAAVRRSARGSVSFDLRDGALKGVNLAQVMRDVKAMLKGQRAEKSGPLKTDFSRLTGTLKVGGGKVRNDDLVMKSPFIRVTGKGDANLVSEALDYLLTAKVVGSATGQGGQEFAELEGIPVGVRVAGTLSEPSFKPDLEAALKALAKKRLQGEQKKLEDRAKGELEKAFKRLF